MANEFPKGGRRKVQTGSPKKFAPPTNQNKPKKHRAVHTDTADFDFKESIEDLAEETSSKVRETEEKEDFPRKGRRRKTPDEYIKHPRTKKKNQDKPVQKKPPKSAAERVSHKGENVDRLRARYRSRMYRLGLNADYLPPAGSSEAEYEEWFKTIKNHPDWVRDSETGKLRLKDGVPVASVFTKATMLIDEFFDGISEHLYQPLVTLYNSLTEEELRDILEKHGEEISDILTFLEKYPLKDLGDNPSADALRQEVLIKEIELYEIFLNGEVMDMSKAYEISNSDDEDYERQT